MSTRKKNTATPPYPFVFDLLGELDIRIRQFFGGYGLYADERILMILYAKEKAGEDKGIWIATDKSHHEALRREIPSLRSIGVLGTSGTTNWQVIPEDDDRFEQDVARACELVRQFDPRIGRIPAKKKKKQKGPASAMTKAKN